MATPRRSHRAPMHRGAQVEKVAWERSRSGKPRRGRPDRPLLTHESGWDWDGARVSFGRRWTVPDSDEEEECACEFEFEEEAPRPTLFGRAHETLSLLDVARYQATERRRKARSGLHDFEVVRIPNVIAISEEGSGLGFGDSWESDEWEKLEGWTFGRTYSEVARGFVDGKDPPDAPGCSRLALIPVEVESWERL